MKKSIAVILLGSAFILPHTSHAEAATLPADQLSTAGKTISTEADLQSVFSKAKLQFDPYEVYGKLLSQYKEQYRHHHSKPEKPSAPETKPEQPSTPVTKPEQPEEKPDTAPQPEQPSVPSEKPSAPSEQPDTETPAPSAPQEQPSQPDSSQVSASQVEQAVLDLTNAERQKAGLKPLQLDSKLMKTAREKSADMAAKNYFSHTSPTYGSPFDQMHANGITYRAAAENIAMGQRSAQEVVQGWMNSPGHRQNILTPGFTHIGIGYDANGNYWTQQFIQK